MGKQQMSESMRSALIAAANRERGNVCPIKGLSSTLRAAAQTALISAMVRRGYVDRDGLGRGVPMITDAGRKAVQL